MPIWERKIPTLAAIILIVVGVMATSFLVKTGVIYLGGAAPSDTPQEVRISNITDRALTITYKTDAPVIGTLSLGKDKDNLQTILDDRDQTSGIPKPYTLHSLSIKNLQPNTTYVFSITSGSTTYLNNNTFFQTKTGAEITAQPSSLPPITGKIVGEDGQPPSEALVFLTTSQGQLLSSLVKSDGIYILPINTYRTSTNQTYLPLTQETKLQLLIEDPSALAHAIITLPTSNPVPAIGMGNDYDFTTKATPVASASAEVGFPAFATDASTQATPVIITPKKDQSFSDAQPQFSGKALPNQTVTIEIHSSDVVKASVTANASGQWTYRPTIPLSPGQHTLSITTINASGILQTIQQSFTVYAAGTQVDQSATPSGSLATPTPTHVLTPTPTRSIIPTSTPTPTLTITMATTISPTPMSKLPPTGSNSLVTIAITGIATSAIGIVLFLLTKGTPLI